MSLMTRMSTLWGRLRTPELEERGATPSPLGASQAVAVDNLQAFNSVSEQYRQKLSQAETKIERYRATLRLAGVEIERRNRSIRILTSFLYQASQLNEAGTLFKLALGQALETTKTTVGAIILIDGETNNLSLGAHERLTPDLLRVLTGRQFDAGAATLMPHLVTGKGALLEKRTAADEGERLLLEAGQISSLLSLPLQVEKRLLGALVIGTKEDRTFSPADIHFLIALSQEMSVALECLHLREKLWHIAEAFLSKAADTSPSPISHIDLNPALPPMPPLQSKLANVVADMGGSMGALFTLNHTDTDITGTLVADYGLSPVFANVFAQFKISNGFFSFEQLARHNIAIDDVGDTASGSLPLFTSLRDEGAESFLLAKLDPPSQKPTKVILIASPEKGELTADKLAALVQMAQPLASLLTEAPAVPTLPTRSVHVPSMTRQATDDDLEQLLSAMMAAEEEVERHNADLSAVNAISEMLSRTLDINKIIDLVVAQVRATIQADAAWVYIIEDAFTETNLLTLKAQENLSDGYVRGMHHITVGDGFEGYVARANAPLYINDVADDPVRCDLLQEQEDIKSVAAVPLACPDERDGHEGSRVVGVLTVAQRHHHKWQGREIRLLNSIAGQVALAVNNAQLFAQVRDGMAMLSSSNQVLQEINKHLMENQTRLEQKLGESQHGSGG